MMIKKVVLPFIIQVLPVLQMIVLSACATTEHETTMQYTLTEPKSELNKHYSDKGWYAVRFSILWEQGEEPKWYIGTLIAGEILSPLLRKFPQEIACWRIHRRAVRDNSGHVFSFIFYGYQTDASLIYQEFKQQDIIAQLQQQNLLVKVVYDPLFGNEQTQIADTSDPAWPDEMRNSWPFFMMGVSQMWLEQTRAYKKETLNEADIMQRYISIQSKITDLWQEQGQHALLHHLNAVYSYEELLTSF